MAKWQTIPCTDGQVEVSPNYDESWEESRKHVDSICVYINNENSETSSGIGLSVPQARELIVALFDAINKTDTKERRVLSVPEISREIT